MLPLSGEFLPVCTFQLVQRMEGCKFLDLINKIVQPLSVLALEGVQFGQAWLHWYSHLV